MATMDADDLLTTTDHAPTDRPRKKLPRYDASYNEKLHAFDKHISELEEQLESAKKRRNALLKTAAPSQRPLAPLLRLPQDVIREIFLACIDPETNPTMSKEEAPTLLTQICSDLRRIALAAPELWASIHIPIISGVLASVSEYAQSLINRQADGVKEWLLRRSGNLPLRISVRRSSKSNIFEPGSNVILTDNIMDVVLSCCSRWRDVFFAIGYRALLPRFANLGPDDVPLLQSFYHTLGVDQMGTTVRTDEPDFWLSCRFLAGPNLRRFCVKTPHYQNGLYKLLLSVGADWGNLTHLGLLGSALPNNDYVTLCDILRQFPRLISLKLLYFTSAFLGMNGVTLPVLQFLELKEYSNVGGLLNAQRILAAIFTPALNTLVYNREAIITQEECDGLLALLKQTPNLTQLTMGDCPVNILLECVQNCPHLVHLDVGQLSYYSNLRHTAAASRELDDHFLSRLFLDNDCLCPRLEYFRTSTIFTPSLGTIRSIIYRKNGSLPHLMPWKALQLSICYDSQNEKEIEQLRAETNADGWKKVDISFCRVFQVVRDVVQDVGHHVQLRRRRDPYLPEDSVLLHPINTKPRDTWPIDTWPVNDSWPLGEYP